MKKKLLNIDKLIPIFSIFLFFLIWEICVIVFNIDKYLLVKPSTIIYSLNQNFELIVYHLTYTLQITIIGLFIASVISVILVILMDFFPIFKSILFPIIYLFQTIPLISIAALFMIWFGFGMSGKIYVVVLVCSFPIIVNLLNGFEEVEKELIDTFYVMKASSFQIYRYLKIPHTISYFLTGLKISVTYGVITSISAEYMGGNRGLGVYLIRAIRSYNIEVVFTIVVVGSLLTLLFIVFITGIEILVKKKRRTL